MHDRQKIYGFLKDTTVPLVKERELESRRRSNKGLSCKSRLTKLKIGVVARHQTPEEQRQMEAALNVFLIEMVRQHLGAEKEND